MAYVPTGRPRGRPRKNPLPGDMTPIPKPAPKPIETRAANEVVLKDMDVPAFISKAEQIVKELRQAADMTNHVKEAELLKNFAICIEKQVVPKYKKPIEVI